MLSGGNDATRRILYSLAPNDIRVKGTRVGIETILYDHEHLGLSPEEIALRYPTLSLEAVYATLTYYLTNGASVVIN